MPNLIERWLLKRRQQGSSSNSSATTVTTQLLRYLLQQCSVCQSGLDGHSYRYIACHPVESGAPTSTDEFLAAFEAGDWIAVQSSQMPALYQPMYIVYAIACPQSEAGTVLLLRAEADPTAPDRIMQQRALPPRDFDRLRATCLSCLWMEF